MNIIYLHTTIWPSTSPSATFVTYYTHALAQAGADTELVVQQSADRPGVEATLKDYFGLEQPEKWSISALRVDGKNNSIRRRQYYKEVVRLLNRRVEEREDLVLITRSLSLQPILVNFKKKHPDIKILFESHDYYSDLSKIERKNIQTIKSFLRERIYLPRCDALICLQKQQENLYREVYPGLRIILLPSGCREFQIDDRDERSFSAVYIGSFDLHKGAGDLLKIWQDWSDSPGLILIGGRSQSDMENLEKQIHTLGLSEKVELIEWKKPALLPQYAARASVGLLPLRDTFFNRNLTFPLKLMDYISAGLPVISSDLPTIRSVLTDARDSIILEDFNPKAVRDGLTSLMDSPELYRSMKENITTLQERYSWRSRAENSLEQISGIGNNFQARNLL